MRYYCMARQGRRRVAVAAWDSDTSCIAMAEDVFRANGYSGEAGRDMERFKNFGGLCGPVLNVSQSEAEHISELRSARGYRRINLPWEVYHDEQSPRHVNEEEYQGIAV